MEKITKKEIVKRIKRLKILRTVSDFFSPMILTTYFVCLFFFILGVRNSMSNFKSMGENFKNHMHEIIGVIYGLVLIIGISFFVYTLYSLLNSWRIKKIELDILIKNEGYKDFEDFIKNAPES
jgi:hypothetical protein